MSRTLIAIKSCWRDQARGDHDSIRRTWAADAWHIPFDLRFFMGHSAPPLFYKWSDEVELDCPDDYDSLPYKTRQILTWSVDQDYDFTFLCDTDTYIIPKKLQQVFEAYRNYDVGGRFGNMPKLGSTFAYRDARGTYPDCHPWPSGGVGYFVSQRAAELIVASKPQVWAEDMMVGQVLGPLIRDNQILAVDIPDFECNIAWHFPRRDYNNQSYHPSFKWMEKMYKVHK